MAVLTTQRKEDGNEEGIFEILRQEIIDLKLKPGEIMSIKEICDHYNVGRSPARDALIHLEMEGLITFLPQRGTMISKIDLDRAEEEHFLRASVEENVMKEFMASHTSCEINRLEMLLWEQEACLSSGDTRKLLELDDVFHEIFYETTGRMFCASVIKSMSGHYRRVRLLTCMNRDVGKQVVKEHGEILVALRIRDMEALLDAFERHINRLSIQRKRLYGAYPDLFVRNTTGESQRDSLNTDFLKTLI